MKEKKEFMLSGAIVSIDSIEHLKVFCKCKMWNKCWGSQLLLLGKDLAIYSTVSCLLALWRLSFIFSLGLERGQGKAERASWSQKDFTLNASSSTDKLSHPWKVTSWEALCVVVKRVDYVFWIVSLSPSSLATLGTLYNLNEPIKCGWQSIFLIVLRGVIIMAHIY